MVLGGQPVGDPATVSHASPVRCAVCCTYQPWANVSPTGDHTSAIARIVSSMGTNTDGQLAVASQLPTAVAVMLMLCWMSMVAVHSEVVVEKGVGEEIKRNHGMSFSLPRAPVPTTTN